MKSLTYRIELSSPMGSKRGWAEIRPEEGRVILSLLDECHLFSGDISPGVAFRASGTLKTAARDYSGVLQGSLSGGRLLAVLRTEDGDFPIRGVRSGRQAATERQAATDPVTNQGE